MEKTDKADARPGDSNRITREYLDSLLVETRLVDCAALYGAGALRTHLFHAGDDGGFVPSGQLLA